MPDGSTRAPTRRLWARATRRRSALAAIVAVALLVAVALAPGGGTAAAFSDFADLNGNSASAAVWEANPPAQCGSLSHYPGGVVYSRAPDAIIHAAAHAIIIATGGNDTIYANVGVCIVVTVGGNTLLSLRVGVTLVLGGAGNHCSSSGLLGLLTCAVWLTLHGLLGSDAQAPHAGVNGAETGGGGTRDASSDSSDPAAGVAPAPAGPQDSPPDPAPLPVPSVTSPSPSPSNATSAPSSSAPSSSPPPSASDASSPSPGQP